MAKHRDSSYGNSQRIYEDEVQPVMSRLEPQIGPALTEAAVQRSIAISLKRVADALDKLVDVGSFQAETNRVAVLKDE